MFLVFQFSRCVYLVQCYVFFSLLVKDALWDVYRFFKLLAVSTMYFLLLLGVMTVASYITFCVVHFPGREQLCLLRQLHLSTGWLFVAFRILLLCDFIMFSHIVSCSCSSVSWCSCCIFVGVHGLGESAVRLKPGNFLAMF